MASTLPTGQIGNVGLFRFTKPDSQLSLQNGATFTIHEFITATGAAADENSLDKVDGVAALGAGDIAALEGRTVCAVVYGSDISVDTAGGFGSLKGATLGLTAFRATSVGPDPDGPELPLLCDIVLAAEEVAFQDSGHFVNGLIPGDGMHIIYPLLMGMNRGRYFLIAGQTLSAEEAQELGLVKEVLPRSDLLPRAWQLAEQLAQQPSLVLRYTRVLLTQHIKGLIQDLLGYDLALEGLGSAQDKLDQG